MKWKLKLSIATALAVACSALFSGCAKPRIVTETVSVVNTQLAQIYYLKGWQDGFTISKGINDMIYTNAGHAHAAAYELRTNFIAHLTR